MDCTSQGTENKKCLKLYFNYPPWYQGGGGGSQKGVVESMGTKI